MQLYEFPFNTSRWFRCASQNGGRNLQGFPQTVGRTVRDGIVFAISFSTVFSATPLSYGTVSTGLIVFRYSEVAILSGLCFGGMTLERSVFYYWHKAWMMQFFDRI